MSKEIIEIKDTLMPVFQKYGERILFAYLFGSVSQDEALPLSDIDIAVFFSGKAGESFFELRVSLYADICRALKRNDIDMVVLNTTRNIMLLDETIRQGVVLFDKDAEFREEFEHRILHRAIDFKEQRLSVIGI
ncbi:MAG: nucleotidyltransferase domain-containing protein [Nitrospirae bacterium]|nr:nucleotidyltransferase domain-containing protein [Nitrospirota bacterium]MBI3377948.1 nucleotidyltransferase domain-containing protein [Nitrospirota bacterium]